MNNILSLEDILGGPSIPGTQFYNSLVEVFIKYAEILPLSHYCLVSVPCSETYGV